MALILSLETSAAICSAAIHRNGNLVHALEIQQPQAHASRLSPLIDELLSAASVSVSQLEAVAVSEGPGSYTGLRIGTSTAKGICLARNLPLIAVPTLEMLARSVADKQEIEARYLCPMVDARRMEVYYQLFDRKGALSPVRNEEIGPGSFSELLNSEHMLFFGDGAAKCRTVISRDHAIFLDGIVPKAEMMGAIASQRLSEGRIEDLVHFVPFYLKEFVAKKAASLF